MGRKTDQSCIYDEELVECLPLYQQKMLELIKKAAKKLRMEPETLLANLAEKADLYIKDTSKMDKRN